MTDLFLDPAIAAFLSLFLGFVFGYSLAELWSAIP